MGDYHQRVCDNLKLEGLCHPAPSEPVILSRVGCLVCPDKDARIAALEAELAEEKLSKKCAVNVLKIERQDARQHAEQAETFAQASHPEAWKRVAQLTASENRKDNALRQAKSALAQAREETLGTARAAERVIEPLARDLAAAREEIERLKVCFLCQHPIAFAGNTGPYCNAPETVEDEGAFAHPIELRDSCHFTPSRWTPRTEGGTDE
ncbi:MAG: hypothetical protein WCY09_09440 [Candidatus Omnitrophota bacterium]